METFTLPRTALPVLTFTGRLLAQEVGQTVDGPTQGRAHDISVYEAEDGQFIVAITFHSPFESELSDSIVEAVDSVDEVDAVLSVYDPVARISVASIDQQDGHRKQTVIAALTTNFDRQVMGVLEKLGTVEYA